MNEVAARWDLSSQEDVEKISKRIRRSYQRIAKGPGDADDCIQEILLRLHDGKHQRATVDQMVIDYVRATHGDKRILSYTERQNIDRAYSFEPRDFERLLSVDCGGERVARVDYSDVRRWIGDKTDRAAFILYVEWGLSEAEIGNLFGFSESRVCQRIQRVQKRLSARIKGQESRDARTRAGGVESVLRAQEERVWRPVEYWQVKSLATEESWGVASFDETGL